MATDFQVKNVLSAKRCEICHQSDCFSPETSICSRCHSLDQNTVISSASSGQSGAIVGVEKQFQAILDSYSDQRQVEINRLKILSRVFHWTKYGVGSTVIGLYVFACVHLWIITGKIPVMMVYMLIPGLSLLALTIYKGGKSGKRSKPDSMTSFLNNDTKQP